MSKGRRKGGVEGLTQREQEVMDLVYQYGPCSANTIQQHMLDVLSNASIRTILRILESKKYLAHEKKGKQYFYKATLNKNKVASQVFNKLLNTFFAGSITQAYATFLDEESLDINKQELEELSKLIEKSKNKIP